MSATRFFKTLPPPAAIHREIGAHLRRVAVLRQLLRLAQKAAGTDETTAVREAKDNSRRSRRRRPPSSCGEPSGVDAHAKTQRRP
jgi:hypothetical protein